MCAQCELPGVTVMQGSVTVSVPLTTMDTTVTLVTLVTVALNTLIVHSARQETVITPLAPLQGLLSLFQTFPQSGVLAATEDVDRTQCSISSSYAFPCVFTRGTNYFTGPELAR